jgi:hypothetical protein
LYNIENTFLDQKDKFTDSHEIILLRKLASTKNVTFCSADKGGALLILNKNDYNSLVLTHLRDKNTYKKLSHNKDCEIINKIKQLCLTYDPCLFASEKSFLFNFIPRTSRFYVLPKIHKSNLVSDICSSLNNEFVDVNYLPSDVPSRPIVSNVESPTSRLSYFIDKILFPLISEVDSYVKDSFDFLNKLPRFLNHNSFMISLDVCSLYTIIPKDFGLSAIQYWLTKYSNLIEPRFSLNFILSSLNLILCNNTFSYKEQHYQQIFGTAMGTCVAPKYAHLTMAYLENEIKCGCFKKFGYVKTNQFFKNYFRYLDDIFVITDLSYGDILSFVDYFNNFHESFKFTFELSSNSAVFLDIKLFRFNDTIITDIYHKPTDSFQYLPFSSNHPRHVKRNVPYILASRIQRIVSDTNLRIYRFNEMKYRLIKLKYPIKLIDDAINRCNKIVNKSTSNNHKQNIYFKFSHTKQSSSLVSSKLQPLFTSFNESPLGSNLFIQKCSRKTFNLKSILSRGLRNFSVSRCNQKRCKTCFILVEAKKYIFINNKIVYFNNNMSCLSENVIYVIFCSCGEFYVGQTSLVFRKRITLHRQHINHPNYSILSVSNHIRMCGGKFSVLPIYFVDSACSYVLEKMENYFITYLKPTLNASVS